MTGQADDPVVRGLRDRISAVDQAIFAAVNRRLELVSELKRHKERRGYAFVDAERERALVEGQVAANRGPLSERGLRELYATLLDLTKRELD